MRKTIVLFPHLGYLSETSRMIAVYKELKKLGAEPLMASHGGTYEWLLKEEGIEWTLVRPEMSVERCQRFVAANRIDGAVRGFYEVDELEDIVRNEMEFLKSVNARVVLTGFNLSLGLSARGAGVYYAVSHLASWSPLIFEKQMQPPFNYLTYKIPKFISRKFLRKVVNKIYLNSKVMLKPYRIVAKRLAIEPIKTTLDMFMGDLTLVTEAPEILGIDKAELEAWVPAKPENFHTNPKLRYTGPIYAKLFGELEQEVKDFIQQPGKTVYLALTSSTSDYIQNLISALLELDINILIASTVHTLELLSDKVMVRKHLPSHRVMPLVDAAVIHGGQGSVQTAVASGCPAVMFPLQTEQMFNAQLIEDRGAGINLALQDLKNPEVVRAAVCRLLEEPDFKTGAVKLQQLQAAYDGPAEAARLLMEI
jgi:UDP:flavonoid glycosyltransferase YjiC (YdhE family)